jgi:TonB family protein
VNNRTRAMPALRFVFAAALGLSSASLPGQAESARPAPASEVNETPNRSPQPITMVSPNHPKVLLEKRVGGDVEVECLVGVDGRPGELRVLSASQPELGEAALDALRQWTFKPGMRDGKPAAMRVRVPFNFPVPTDDPLEHFARRRLYQDIEDTVVPAEQMPNWPMPKKFYVPRYPKALQGSGKRGMAVVGIVINKEGKVVNPKIVKATHPEFAQPALAAAVSLEFQPQMLANKEKAFVSMNIQFDFKDESNKGKQVLPAEPPPRKKPAPEKKAEAETKPEEK